LKRLWEERAKVPWGMPNKEYNIQDALMLLNDDEDDDDDTEYVSALFSDPEEDEKNVSAVTQ
jgi:hypothetical protein